MRNWHIVSPETFPEVKLRRIFWRFKTEEERKAYESSRRPLSRDFLVGLIVVAPASVLVYAFYGFYSTWFPIFSIIALAWMPATRQRYRIEYGLEGIQIKLNAKSIDVLEWFDGYEHPIRIARIYRRSIKGARWASEGLQFDVRPSLQRQVVLNYRLLFSSGGIDRVTGWCAEQGIGIEGVRPLREGYQRDMEMRRGL